MLGLDPGTLATGFGIIRATGSAVTLVCAGIIRNAGSVKLPLRLTVIHREVVDLIRRYKPDECAIESAFYGRNAQSALKLGHARGVVLLAASNAGLPIDDYTPREIKKAVTGNGNASKEQVKFMVRAILDEPETPLAHDASDALAVALCHIRGSLSGTRRHRSWKAFVDLHPERLAP